MYLEMGKKESLPNFQQTVFILILILLDVFLKNFAENNLDRNVLIEFIPFVSFYLTSNSGIAFSLLDFNNLFTSYGILVIGMFIVFFLFKLLNDQKKSTGRLAFIFIIGGALGNLIDRALDGEVTDFLLLYFGNISFFVFNPADFFITIGAIFFIANEISSKIKKGEQ